ncbi:hypothetical protein NHX12_011725 [Muraenolepis orangiensis]|uniref:Uncharacterized protein n=1 Tax=Muraenolepis orangiensis TaxID=630683 RepID=A0A9Q0I7G7_9TELE|nr:hypothetical protein NHX12_011725 [Muraenolepis orangiensis]
MIIRGIARLEEKALKQTPCTPTEKPSLGGSLKSIPLQGINTTTRAGTPSVTFPPAYRSPWDLISIVPGRLSTRSPGPGHLGLWSLWVLRFGTQVNTWRLFYGAHSGEFAVLMEYSFAC